MSKELSYLEAIREALREEMRRDPKVFVLGEDVGAYGGAFGVTQGLYEEFGEMRVVDTPISESAIVGISIGAAELGRDGETLEELLIKADLAMYTTKAQHKLGKHKLEHAVGTA